MFTQFSSWIPHHLFKRQSFSHWIDLVHLTVLGGGHIWIAYPVTVFQSSWNSHCMRVPTVPHPCQHLAYSFILSLAIQRASEWYCPVVLFIYLKLHLFKIYNMFSCTHAQFHDYYTQAASHNHLLTLLLGCVCVCGKSTRNLLS